MKSVVKAPTVKKLSRNEIDANPELKKKDTPYVEKGSLNLEEIKASPEWERRILPAEKYPKRKYAVAFGYCGTNYQGLQINPGAVSVEAVLEKALLLSGVITEDKFGDLHNIHWTRAARTDKGVHAVAQCCGMKINIPNVPPVKDENQNIASDTNGKSAVAVNTSNGSSVQSNSLEVYRGYINSFLPNDIHVHHISKVTKSFNAKLACFGRNYQYLLPTYSCLPKKEIDQMFAKIVTDKELNASYGKCLAYSEGDGAYNRKIQQMGPEQLKKMFTDNALGQFRISNETLATLRKTLKMFEGTNNFHNYTSHKDHSDPSAKRYIISFIADEPFVDPISGIEFVCLQVQGQSFLLNQIRRMVSVAVDVVRQHTTADTITKSFTADKMEMHMAPGLGLYLNELQFDKYNRNVVKENNILLKLSKKRKANATHSSTNAADCATVNVSSEIISTDSGENSTDNREETDEHCGKKIKISSENNDTPISVSVSTNSNSKVSIEGDPEEIDISLNETLDWSKKPELSDRLRDFKEKTIWPHIMKQESENYEFLQYLYFITYISYKDYSFAFPK